MTWHQTYKGTKFDFLNPTVDMIDFAEIALVLSRFPRFGGHTKLPINVAQHTLAVADVCYQWRYNSRVQSYAYLHDAHEAYIGDIITPLNQAITALTYTQTSFSYNAIKEIKQRIDRVIYQAAFVEPPSEEIRAIVKEADLAVLWFEKEHFMGKEPEGWGIRKPRFVIPDEKYLLTYYTLHPDDAADELESAFDQIVNGEMK